MSHAFQPRGPHDIAALIAAKPLAWVVSRKGDGLHGTTLPPLAKLDANGNVAELVGHFARSNPHLATLRRDPCAHILFLGPNAYISPSWVRDRTWGPTWNYAHAQFQVELTFFEPADEIAVHLRELVHAMERGRSVAWSIEEMGSRFTGLARGIVGFCARVRAAESRFKLGQDERDEIFADILAGIQSIELRGLMEAVGRPKS